MKRREFITLLGATAAFPRPARAQTYRMRRIGVLMAGAELDLEWPRLEAALEQELKNLGWTRGRDIRIDYRWPGDDADRINAYAIDLVELGPDLIVAASTFGVQAVRRRTESIPVIFMNVTDPVASGLVPNLTRPGGATTGFTAADYRICGKWLEIIKEMSPRTSRVAIIFNPDTASHAKNFLSPIEAAAPAFATKPVSTPFRSAQEIERAIEGFARTPSALLIVPDSGTILHRQQIIELASKHKLPAVYPFRFFAADGGLASFGINLAAQCSEVAAYIDRILRGRGTGELPVQPPSKFELVINMKTAKTANIAMPPALLARANEVIE